MDIRKFNETYQMKVIDVAGDFFGEKALLPL